MNVIFRFLYLLGLSKSLKKTGQNTPTCAVFCSIWTPRPVRHEKRQNSANKAVVGPKNALSCLYFGFRASLNRWFAKDVVCMQAQTPKIKKTTKMTKAVQTATNKELSVALTEITETTEMMKMTGIQGANHRFPKRRVQTYPKFGEVLHTVSFDCFIRHITWRSVCPIHHPNNGQMAAKRYPKMNMGDVSLNRMKEAF